MTHLVTMPDGSTHIFPDEATPDMISEALGLNAASSAPQIGAVGRFAQGMTDPSNAVAQMGLHAAQHLPDNILPDAVRGADQYLDNKISSDEANYQARREASGNDGVDWMRMGGSGVATAPITALMPSGGAAMLGKIGAGMASGGATAALQPTTDPNQDFSTQKLEQVGLGTGLGGVFAPIASSVGKFITGEVKPEVQTLMNNGITPTMGQIVGGNAAKLEEKLSSLPLVGGMIKNSQSRALDQFNTAALGRALDPLGQAAPSKIGREGIQAVKDSMDNAYNKIIPQLTFKSDQQFSSDLGQLKSLAQNLPDQQANQFNKIIDAQIHGKLSNTGQMDGETYKGSVQELGQQAKGYSSDSSYDNRQLGAALQQAQALMKGGLARSNPSAADELNSIDKGYANYAILRNAGSRLGANGQEEMGKFTPAQLQSAVRASDSSVGKGKFATGNALMQDLSDAGLSILGSKYPDSGTAGREAIGVLIGSLLEGGGALTGHAALPIAAGGLATLPYTQTGQKLAAALLTKRPNLAKPIGNAIADHSQMLGSMLSLPAIQGAQ